MKMKFNKALTFGISLILAGNITANAQKVTFNGEQMSLKQAFEKIESVSKYKIAYNTTQLDVNKTVVLNQKNVDVLKVLDVILSGTGCTYEISDGYIVITPLRKGTVKKIEGTVKDASGEPVIGATVIVKGTTNGTVTDFDGKFSLDASEREILVVSYIGYKPQEVKAVSGRSLTIELVEDTEVLDEVVVVGFGTQKKVNLTGSVGVADAKVLESRPVSSATQALQGLVPGLQISTNTGEIDKDMNLNIRGTGTIGQGSSGSPLVLIDGMEGDLNTVNPQDIETVSVLKDAAASSIYGSRAPFGVILVTTKKGKSGKTSINYNNSFRVSSPMNLPEMMDSYTFANFFNQASMNQGASPVFKNETLQKMLDYQSGKISGGVDASANGQWGAPDYPIFDNGYANVDWFAELYKKNVFSQEHNVSLSGGNEKLTYYASFNYLSQSGLLRHGEDGLKRYNVTAKINSRITDWLKFNYTMRYTNTDIYKPTEFTDDLYGTIGRQTWPNLPVYDPNGFYYMSADGSPAILLAEGGDRNQNKVQMYHQAALLIEPIKNWITHVEFNYRTYDTDVDEVSLPCYNHDVDGKVLNTNGTSSLLRSFQKDKYINLNVFTEYSHSFVDKHNLKTMLGFQCEESSMDFNSTKKYGLMMDDMPVFDLTTGLDGVGKEKLTEVAGYKQEWATAGFFGRINYDYEGKYLAEVNMRYDGSSRFRRGNRWSLYPSFSLGWNMAREGFWKPIEDYVNLFKVRFSYGELGNQNTTSFYPTYRAINMGAYNGKWLQDGKMPNTSLIGDLISESLTWETIRTWNIGFDYGLFNNRLTGSFDLYTRYTDNMVGPAPELPYVLGLEPSKVNNCDLRTVGWELQIGWNDRLNNGLGYSAKLMLSDARTYIDRYPGNVTNSIDTYVEGREVGEIWGFETAGIAKSDEEMNEHLEKVGGQTSLGSNWAAGDIMYADLDGKPGITKGAQTVDDHGDLKVIGNNTPRYQFGIDLSADWKGFDFRCFFQGVLKRDVWQGSNMFWGVEDNKWWSMGLAEHGDYFRAEPIGLNNEIPANLDAYYPRPIFKYGSKNHEVQTRYLQNASYIRLKNLQIGYTIPAKYVSKIGLSSCRFFVSGENLWTGTKLSDLFDPETITGAEGRGNTYPLSSTWSFGLSLTL